MVVRYTYVRRTNRDRLSQNLEQMNNQKNLEESLAFLMRSNIYYHFQVHNKKEQHEIKEEIELYNFSQSEYPRCGFTLTLPVSS